MRRLFSLLPLLLPLPNLVQAADPVCTLENRVCAENNNSGKCIRYENTFTCVTVNPAGSRCTVDANPTLTDCMLSAPVCSAESGGICLETTTDFVCKSEPSGEGIRIDDTSVTVSYSKETKGEIPAGCIIGAEVCLDDDARDIEVENWEGHFVSANPVCWVTERTILCPSVDGAASCQKLELAGCEKLTDPVCETEEHGVCVRWSSTYRCTRDEVIGDDIITDDVVTTPGDVTEDDSACRKELEDAAARGENCTVNSRVCVKTDPAGVLPCLEYRTTMTCTSSSTDTCGSLKNLSGSGDCMLAAEPECTLTDTDGNCRRTESTYVCTDSVTSESVSPATFLKAMTVQRTLHAFSSAPAKTAAARRRFEIDSLSQAFLESISWLESAPCQYSTHRSHTKLLASTWLLQRSTLISRNPISLTALPTTSFMNSLRSRLKFEDESSQLTSYSCSKIYFRRLR